MPILSLYAGITNTQKRVIVAIRCSIRMEVPLGQLDHLLVPAEYVQYLVSIANEKMETNRKRTESFLHVLKYKVRLLCIILYLKNLRD